MAHHEGESLAKSGNSGHTFNNITIYGKAHLGDIRGIIFFLLSCPQPSVFVFGADAAKRALGGDSDYFIRS